MQSPGPRLISAHTPERAADGARSAPNSAIGVARSRHVDALRIDHFLLDIGALRCTGPDQKSKRLTLKAMNVLLELAFHPNETRTREALLDAVWPDTCPTPEVLTQAIKELRKLFADDQKTPTYIETIPKIGYRLLPTPKWHYAEPFHPQSCDPQGADAVSTSDTVDEQMLGPRTENARKPLALRIASGAQRAPEKGESTAMINAWLSMTLMPGFSCVDVMPSLRTMPEVVLCQSVAGEIDLLVYLQTLTLEQLATMRETVLALKGVDTVVTHLVLRTQLDRR
jgi:DNA-binding winged helix-turn-helix (wHTH) protein/DNA-binding Lrp family transcriptional regulator